MVSFCPVFQSISKDKSKLKVKIGGAEQFAILKIKYAVYVRIGNHSQRFPNSTTPIVAGDYVHRNILED